MNDPFRGRKKRNWLLVISPRQSHIFSKKTLKTQIIDRGGREGEREREREREKKRQRKERETEIKRKKKQTEKDRKKRKEGERERERIRKWREGGEGRKK
jgi:hypothetical protein